MIYREIKRKIKSILGKTFFLQPSDKKKSLIHLIFKTEISHL